MSGSSPLADVVTRSIGTAADGFSFFELVDVALNAVDQRLVGRCRGWIRRSWRHCRVPQSVLVAILRDQARSSPTAGHGNTCRCRIPGRSASEPTTLPSRSIMLPFAW